MSRPAARGLAALLAGAALGAAAAAGAALLLYTGQGFLRAAGLLVASTIMAVAAGIWAGAPETEGAPVESRGRWVAVIVALLGAGVFSTLWMGRAALRDAAAGGALSVLLIIALPAYTAGALFAALHARAATPGTRGSSVPALAVAGAAIGVLLATTVLIQTLEPYGIYYGTAGVLTLVSLLESGARAQPRSPGTADMNDKVAIITGVGSRGQVGYAIARAFRAAGARLLLVDRAAEVEAIARELGSDDVVYAMRADLSNTADAEHVVQMVRERWGRLDVLVNVAGGLRVVRPLADTRTHDWDGELQRNATTVLVMSRAALPLLRESRGAIINFASPAGVRAAAGIGAYSAAKAAVVALTRALALEEKEHGVRVNAIAPGMVDTEQNRGTQEGPDQEGGTAPGEGPADRFVSREEIASVALFLAGEGSSGISGETIHVLGPTLE